MKPEVHVSDIKTFRECRWRWDWSSSLRQNLERGIPVPHFLLGRAVHYALSRYYEGDDALTAYETYIERDLELSEFLEAMELEAKSKIVEAVVLGRAMVAHYLTWCPPRDKLWEVLSTEQSVKHTEEELGFTFSSRFDGVWRRRSDGTLWLKEFKTTRSMTELSFIERDPQPMLYSYIAQKKFGQPIEGILYTFLWKKAPEMPRELKDGMLSKATNQSTTAALYRQSLEAQARAIGGPNWEVIFKGLLAEYAVIMQYYLEQEEKYFKRVELRKTETQLAINLQNLTATIGEMLNPATQLYPSDSQLKCPRCPFRDPCRIRLAGGSYDLLLQEEFRTRRGWDDLLAEEADENEVPR